jgi:ubiquinone/menaquinone biosynthesis C-methylase UbiE
MNEYQLLYSKINSAMYDRSSRISKYFKIYKVVTDFKGDISNCVCLDIGCSAGFMIDEFSRHTRLSVGIDIDKSALDEAKNTLKDRKAILAYGDGLKLPFKDQSLDIVICNHIYEHVPDSSKLFGEIHRVLKHDGICYLAAGNRYNIIEAHYRLPFLSWVPKPVANLYLQVLHRGTKYYENHLSYRGLMRSLRKFRVYDHTIKILKDPDIIKTGNPFIDRSILSNIPGGVYRLMRGILPTYIFIMTRIQNN